LVNGKQAASPLTLGRFTIFSVIQLSKFIVAVSGDGGFLQNHKKSEANLKPKTIQITRQKK